VTDEPEIKEPKSNDAGILHHLAAATAKAYLNALLVSIQEGEPTSFIGLMESSIKQAADDFDDWEAVPEASRAAMQGEGVNILLDAVESFVHKITSGSGDADISLRVAFHAEVQKNLSQICNNLREFIYAK
jgi:uncharacterized protein YPO0396